MSAMQHELLAWWRAEGRDLPWRLTRDPWAVLVSETMLQHTQVPRVLERFRAFLELFPTPAACAAAPVAEVIRAWQGLGYNRRAVNLHRCATAVVDDHDGALPDDLDALRALPGIGPYTARAVLVFAFGRDLGLVDTNAGRFLARAAVGAPVPRADAERLADSLVPRGEGWAWGQAVFDLGALVCTRRAPRCDSCPIRRRCAWARGGFAPPDPVEGSAGISAPQSAFAPSDRRGRGLLVDALRQGPVPRRALAELMGWPDDPERAARVAESLVADGLAARTASAYRLP
jgi:A/G-specific adenine glycosylase